MSMNNSLPGSGVPAMEDRDEMLAALRRQIQPHLMLAVLQQNAKNNNCSSANNLVAAVNSLQQRLPMATPTQSNMGSHPAHANMGNVARAASRPSAPNFLQSPSYAMVQVKTEPMETGEKDVSPGITDLPLNLVASTQSD